MYTVCAELYTIDIKHDFVVYIVVLSCLTIKFFSNLHNITVCQCLTTHI